MVAFVTNPNVIPHLGKIVTCVCIEDPNIPTWKTTPELEPGSAVYDGALRPIRDPGDDAQDETLQWLQVPATEEVTA